MNRSRTPFLPLFFLAFTLSCPATLFGASQVSVDKAHNFLKTEQRGKEILAFLHFGADYLDHRYVAMKALDDGSFALGYKFRWRTTDDGYTNVAFLCDSGGNVQKVVVVDTDAIINGPFVFANLSIQLLGQMLIDNYRDRMSESDRRQLQ